MIPVKDNHALYRDENSNAIVSTDMTEYKRYVDARKRKEDEKSELDSLKNDINEIKEMLRNLSNGN
jgi:predicted AlkP superfamily phosphohydrolase/phosphomutase